MILKNEFDLLHKKHLHNLLLTEINFRKYLLMILKNESDLLHNKLKSGLNYNDLAYVFSLLSWYQKHIIP